MRESLASLLAPVTTSDEPTGAALQADADKDLRGLASPAWR